MTYQISKRALDLLVCLALAPLALPLCAILLAAIRLESPGSPLFIQWRIGRNGEKFRMAKLRTMRADTVDLPSHVVGAAQITALGAVLRRFKLDELPQLANIASGTMSLVGPRPCLPAQEELIAERAKRGVLAVRPGVTGAAQIEGIDMSDPRRLAEADAAYVRSASLGRDVAILLRTVMGGGRGDAATRASR